MIVVLSLHSCALDEDGYYSDSFGVVRLSSKNLQYIESDEGEILMPNQSISSFVETGDRVWISYTIEEENGKRDTLTVTPYRITRIMPLSLQHQTTLNEHGIDLWTVWIAQGFLTFDFRIRAKDQEKIKEHKYALVTQQTETADTLFINFRHDNMGDNYGVLCRTGVALNLKEIHFANDPVTLVIDYMDFAGTRRTEYRTYKKTQY